MKRIKEDKIVEILLAKGCKEIKSKSKKYRKFERPGTTDFYFIGHNGALRAGKNISDSVSLTRFIKA